MKCNRCQKELVRPDKRNAYYVSEMRLKNNVLERRNIIICKKCKNKNDTVLW